MISKNDYLIDPCKASSIPYWKTKLMSVPEGMVILHQDDFNKSEYPFYSDEHYFRLIHKLKDLPKPIIPKGYILCSITVKETVSHINSCYDDIEITESELRNYLSHSVYESDLWIAVKESSSGKIVATGIAELDQEIGEGILEWIQVSQEYRGYGLGKYVVSELLRRMKSKAGFVTVSGNCSNPSNPEALYRKCGFTGSDIWHILKRS